jgi:hypothetical protein
MNLLAVLRGWEHWPHFPLYLMLDWAGLSADGLSPASPR